MKSIRERKSNFIENQNDDVKILRDYWNWKFRKKFFAENRIRLVNIKHVLNEIDLTIDDIRKIFTKNSRLQQWILKKHLFIDQIMRFDEEFRKFKFVWKSIYQIEHMNNVEHERRNSKRLSDDFFAQNDWM